MIFIAVVVVLSNALTACNGCSSKEETVHWIPASTEKTEIEEIEEIEEITETTETIQKETAQDATDGIAATEITEIGMSPATRTAVASASKTRAMNTAMHNEDIDRDDYCISVCDLSDMDDGVHEPIQLTIVFPEVALQITY